MTREELKGILPHREPMLLLDEAAAGGDGNAYGKYKVRGDEWFLQGHFPGKPVVPGVIQCEMLAQTCCVLMAENMKGKTPLFTGIDKARFRGMVLPGDTMEFVCSLNKAKPPFYFAKGEGYVGGKLCVSGEFSFALIEGV
ncbi:MAG: 3-hydroxyacyl-ACP dehydratase FabZ family protein [Bacillota bacterium]|nr:3-hydroxyacyl-ACP dehydratase FabZ family protein [Bacillota bacterium]